VVFWMLIWETVIWDMLTRAFTPTSRATAAIVTVASRYPADTDAEVDPPTAADDPIDVGRFEQVSHHHLGASGPQGRRPAVLAANHGANRKPAIEEQACHGSPDRPKLTRCPG
jgi:hypothetical protein